MKRNILSKRGNALVLILIVLTMLAAFGLSHLLMSRTGIRQSQVLFKGIDANFLLEGLVSQAENQIRKQANDYDDTPKWFNTFRDTSIGGESAFAEVDLSGTPIKKIADEAGYEIKVVARFIANSRVYAFRNGGVKEDITLEGGKEKWGQLEIKAQVKIGKDYYHAHAAKDVKVINPLTLSYNGQYNDLHKYNMYIKYAYEEYGLGFRTKYTDSDLTRGVRGGNYIYNRYTDEESDTGNNKIADNYYFIRLKNGDKDKKAKVYLGTAKRDRNEKNKILVDLPRKSYGDFYTEQVKKPIYTIKFNKKDPDNPSDDYSDQWLQMTFKQKTASLTGTKWKTKTKWEKVTVCEENDHKIMKSVIGPGLEDTWVKIKEAYEKAYNESDGIKDAHVSFPTDSTTRDGDLIKYMIATGVSAEGAEPVIEKTVTGFEYSAKPWSVAIDSPGIAEKTTKVNDDGFINKNYFMVNLPPNYKLDDKTTDPMPLQRYMTTRTYSTYFTYNSIFNNGKDLNMYDSFAHSSLIDDTTLNIGLNGTDTSDGFRAHPTLQLRGIWANNSWSSDTEIEGNVWARYLETYYMVMKDKDDDGNFTGKYRYVGLTPYDYDGVDITGYNGDLLYGKQIKDMKGMKGENINGGLLNIMESLKKYASDDPDSEKKNNSEKWQCCYGPEIRHEVTNDPMAETLRSDDPNNNNGYNSRAIFVPYNGKTNPVMPLFKIDPDFQNIYLDKVTAVFTNFKEFSEKNMKLEDGKFILYLNGIYMINSLNVVNLPEFEYVGKGALLFAGNISVNGDILPKDPEHDLLILATIGRRNEDGSLGASKIVFKGDSDRPLEIKASLVAMNRDFIDSISQVESGYGKNLGMVGPCKLEFTYGANIYGQWSSDLFNYYPDGPGDEPGNNEDLKGTNLKYDPRFFESHKDDSEYYLADIGLPFSFWKVWKNKASEI